MKVGGSHWDWYRKSCWKQARMMSHHLGITHRILRMGLLLNWLGKVLAKTRFYKEKHRWAWEMAQEVWSSRESLLYLQLMAAVKVSHAACYTNYSSTPNLDYSSFGWKAWSERTKLTLIDELNTYSSAWFNKLKVNFFSVNIFRTQGTTFED